MTCYTFLASSKQLELPEEIADYTKAVIYNDIDKYFNVSSLEGDYYAKPLRGILTLPYLYYVKGVGNSYFWLYLDKYMEVGDVLEIVMIHNINRIDKIVEKMLEKPSSIHLNVGRLTYKNEYGTFQLHRKNWIDDAKHRTILTEHGVTTIEKY